VKHAVLKTPSRRKRPSSAPLSGKNPGMDSDKKVVETKETTKEKTTIVEDVPSVPEPRRGETVTIETHTEG
jgi:hypothetical protein